MTSQTDSSRHVWRRMLLGGLASGAAVAGLLAGVGAPASYAQPDGSPTETAAADARAPGESCTGEDCAKRVGGDEAATEGVVTMSADEALSIIYNEYALGDGGGQLSKLVDDVMALRAQGFKPSTANKLAIQEALEHRPNQTPLVEALKETLAYQRKLQAQAQMAVEEGPVAGPVPKYTSPTGDLTVPVAPGGDAGITIPIG